MQTLIIGFTCGHILMLTGLYGLFFRRDNLIISMICLEIALLGTALIFALASLMLGDLSGIIMFLMLLTLAGVESALGLALVISYYRLKTSIRWSSLAALRG
jgi:NADH:ubiquinone oxidoreductase subunit K